MLTRSGVSDHQGQRGSITGVDTREAIGNVSLVQKENEQER
jgi:hypothetical protein